MSVTFREDEGALAPESHANPPGQSSLAYRAGRHGSFKAAMKAALARKPALQGLTTRSDDDFSIALLDSAATVMDVLTFYQERIANEGYLRTAGERLSLLELAHAIGYELRPGVASGTHLAFEVESAPTSAALVSLEAGIRAQSVPAPGELPQTFETVEKIDARPEWNLLKPQTSLPFRPTRQTLGVTLQGTATNLKQGDFLLIVGDERINNLGSEQWDVRRIEALQVDARKQVTQVSFSEALGWELPPHIVNPAGKNVHVYAFRARAALFGHNAPDWRLLPDDVQARFLKPTGPHRKIILKTDQWPGFDLDTSRNIVELDAVYPAIVPGSWTVLSSPDYVELGQVLSTKESAEANFGLSSKVSQLTLEIENFANFSKARRSALLLAQSEELAIAESPLVAIPAAAPSGRLHLEAGALAPLEGGEVILERVVADFARGRAIAVSGQRMRVRVLTGAINLRAANGISKSIPYLESLLMLQSPIQLPGGLTRLSLQDKAGFQGSADVTPEQVSLMPAAPGDAPVSEVALVERCRLAADETHTLIQLQRALSNSYDRATISIQGNLAFATQGETRREILGSGDAGRPWQRFTLKQSPLTYISADTPSGAASTLQLRVNDLLWEPAGSLYGADAGAQVYAARQDDEGKTSIQFGDGSSGARPPSGSENIVAVYRIGSGRVGNVAAVSISLLQSRPLGLKAVSNPLPASGGDDPEPRDQARRNAPMTTLTLDRLVSLQDYEDFSRAFAGIAKAQAAWLWDGAQRTVLISVAGPNGLAVKPGERTYDSLVQAIRRYGLPYQPFLVVSHTPLRFALQARVEVDPRRSAETVLASVRAALHAAFGFEARDLAGGVAASQVLAVIQSVPGVVMADLNTLHLNGTAAAATLPLPALRANPARRDSAGVIQPAELLSLDDQLVDLIEVL
jgi:hypothetical protein